MFKQNIFTVAAIVLFSNAMLAQNPKFDSTFGTNGRILSNLSPYTAEIATGMAFTNDNKIVCVGHDRTTNANGDKFIVARYTGSGAIDKTFNGTGFNAIELIPSVSKDFGFDVVVLPDNSVVGVGYATANTKTSVVVVKFKPDGTLDNTFGGAGNGRAILNFGNIDYGKAILALPNGKLLIGCKLSGAPGVIRLNANGTLDTSFQGTGFSEVGSYSDDIEVNRMILDKNNNIILVGEINNDNAVTTFSTDMFFMRFSADGAIVNDIKRVGKVGKLEVCYDILQEQDGNFLMVGTRNKPSSVPTQIDTLINLIVRVNQNGDFVKEYANDFGKDVTETFRSVALQRDGSIVVAGNLNKEFLIVRFKKDLTLDASFTQTKLGLGFKTELNRVLINSYQQIFGVGYNVVQGSGDNDFVLTKLITNLTPNFEADDNNIPLNLFPNPTSNVLNINYQLSNASEVYIEIYDLLGKKVGDFAQGFRTAEAQSDKIELSNLENGTYICRIVTKDGASNSKFTFIK